jgi:Ca2+-binding EF-hand superfamily protein
MNAVENWLIAATLAGYLAAFASVHDALAASPPSAGDAALFERLDADSNGRLTDDEVPAEQQRLFARLLRRGDSDDDHSLSRDEFIAGLIPSRPEKPLDQKLPSSSPQADAVRWLLLTMDTSGNGSIEEDEVPDRLRRLFDRMTRQIDSDEDGIVNRRELNRGGRQLVQIAVRYVRAHDIDVAAELGRMEKKLGAAARRFDSPPPRLDNLGNPRRARQIFSRLDSNRDGQLERSELPEQLRRPIGRLMRQGDRDRDGRLSEREFLAVARQFARRRQRQNLSPVQVRETKSPESMPADESMRAEASMPADSE